MTGESGFSLEMTKSFKRLPPVSERLLSPSGALVEDCRHPALTHSASGDLRLLVELEQERGLRLRE